MFNSTLRMSSVKRLMLCLALVVTTLCSLPLASSAVAQETGLTNDTTYILLNGQEVAWAAPWQYNEEYSGINDPLEVVFLDTQLSSLSVVTFPNVLDIEEVRDLFITGLTGESETFVTIDKGAYSGLSYSLDLLSLSGIEFGSFTLFRAGSGDLPTIANIFLSPVSLFATEFASAQTDVTLDGETLFGGVDGSGLQAQLEANSGLAPEETPTDDPTEESDDPASTPKADTPSEGGFGDKLRGGNDETDPTAEPTEDSTTNGPENVGLIDETTYVSPQYFAEVTWGSSFAVDTEREVHLSSNEDTGVDLLALVTTGSGTSLIQIQFIADNGATPEQLVELWQTPDFVADTTVSPDDVEILLADSTATGGGVIYRDFLNDGTEITTYREVRVLEDRGAIVLLTYNSLPGNIEQGVGNAQAELEIDGVPVLDFFDLEEILGSL